MRMRGKRFAEAETQVHLEAEDCRGLRHLRAAVCCDVWQMYSFLPSHLPSLTAGGAYSYLFVLHANPGSLFHLTSPLSPPSLHSTWGLF